MHRRLTDAVALGLLGIGVVATLAPRTTAVIFGIAASDASARAYVRATGARDAIVGAILLAVRDDDMLRPRVLALTSLIGLVDAIGLAAARGLQPSHAAHTAGFIAAALIALTDRP